MASLGSASAFHTYGQGHGEPRFEGDRRHSPFGARAHDAFGYPGTGDVGWGASLLLQEGLSSCPVPGNTMAPTQNRVGRLGGPGCPMALWTVLHPRLPAPHHSP